MAATATTRFPIPAAETAATTLPAQSLCRRRIDPQSGRALEILGHAIEYLAVELVHKGGTMSAGNAQLEAIHLMALNRQVYFACPTIPTLGDRCRALLRLRSA